MNWRLVGYFFMFSLDVFNIIWNIWHWIRTINQTHHSTLALNTLMWLIGSAIPCVQKYIFHAYICTIIGQLVFVLYSVKDSLQPMINSVSCFKFLSTFSGISKSRWNVLVSHITSILSLMYTPLFIRTWLNCYNFFWWYYHTDTKD